jgi:hypothetical protein
MSTMDRCLMPSDFKSSHGSHGITLQTILVFNFKTLRVFTPRIMVNLWSNNYTIVQFLKI